MPTSRLPALQETASALLRTLSAGGASNHDLARLVVLDPVLVFDLLQTAPLTDTDRATLRDAIADRLGRVDAGLLQGWALRHLIQQAQRRLSARTHRRHALHSVLVAELAVGLALETGYPQPDEAYTAGLMHDIGLLWMSEYGDHHHRLFADAIDEGSLAAAEWERYGLDHAEISSSLAVRCGFSAGIADAIALHHAAPDSVATAHPLVRIVAAAEELACYRDSLSATRLDTASRLARVEGSLLVSLLADTTRSMQDKVSGLDIVVEPAMLTLAWDTSAGENERELTDAGIARTALNAFARSAFVDAATARPAFDVATRLLLGFDAPVLFVEAPGEDSLIGAADLLHPELEQIRVATGDAHSALAEAFRTDSETRYQNAHRPPGRSATDWQVARWLGSDGLLCVPWRNAHEAGVAVFPCASTENPGNDIEPSLRKAVTEAATARIAERHADEKRRSDIAESIARRYIDHARRVAHEASTPLTVIKTYLGIIDERVEDPALKGQLALLGGELDRVGSLVRQASEFTSLAPSEAACSGVTEILHDLRALYGEALFTRKGIHFELRIAPTLPPAAIPPDVLKQIFLNLFKNAAEAIPEGGKLTVSAVSGINANGHSCMEIRVVDNGAGLPSERVETLFAAGPREGGGVGLPLVRDLVASVGGTILCRSHPGSGTVFQIFIPLAAMR